MSVELARAAVMAYGWNATAYQILNPGIQHWFSREHPAVLGFVQCGRVLVVAGAPVCEWSVLGPVCEEFESFARRLRCRVCYVCTEERLRALFADSPAHSAIALGAQPVWNPASWQDIVRSRASLRAQLHRAQNKGVTVETLNPESAAVDPVLKQVLRHWLKSRRLPPLHFLAEPDLLDGVMRDRVVLLARRHETPVAFLVASPIRARRGYLVELIARSPDAPNGASELLIDAAMRRFAAEGSDYVTLGLVALARAADDGIRANPGWLRMMMYYARAHANRFYNFRGLEHFRVKMQPAHWDSVYAISNERQFSPRSLYAIGEAFAGIAPWAAITLGLLRAARDEISGAFRRRPPSRRAFPDRESSARQFHQSLHDLRR